MLSESYFLPSDVNGCVTWPHELGSSTVICWSLSFETWLVLQLKSQLTFGIQAGLCYWETWWNRWCFLSDCCSKQMEWQAVCDCVSLYRTHPCALPDILLSCSLLLSHGRIGPEGEHVVALAHVSPIQHTCDFYHSEPLGDYGFQSQTHKWDNPINLSYGICSFQRSKSMIFKRV